MNNIIKNKSMKSIFSHEYENYSFEFFLDNQYPYRDLVTCVFCVLKDEKGDIWLTKNHRGWELPGGHIEPGENYREALEREIFEEIGVQATDFQLVGYKKNTNFKKNANRHGGFYPFPHSYILFFTGVSTSEKISPFPLGEDETLDSGLFSNEKVFEQLDSENNKKILQSILDNK